MSNKKFLKGLRDDKKRSPLDHIDFISLIKYLDTHSSYVNMNMVLEWTSRNDLNENVVRGLLLQLALYSVDLITKGESNEEKHKDLEYDEGQLEVGRKVEMEHTTYHFLAEKIAKDHLAEGGNYYKLLEKMEEKVG